MKRGRKPTQDKAAPSRPTPRKKLCPKCKGLGTIRRGFIPGIECPECEGGGLVPAAKEHP